MSYRENFIDEIVSRSEGDTWKEAVREWKVVGCVEDHTRSTRCVCGKERLLYVYEIVNVCTGESVPNIGSECIKKFGREELDGEAKCWRQVFKLLDAAIEAGDLREVPLAPPYYSRRLLEFFFERGVFKPSRWNGGRGYFDFEFLLDMFNAREWSDAQERKIRAVVRAQVRPFLAAVWRRRKAMGESLGERLRR